MKCIDILCSSNCKTIKHYLTSLSCTQNLKWHEIDFVLYNVSKTIVLPWKSGLPFLHCIIFLNSKHKIHWFTYCWSQFSSKTEKHDAARLLLLLRKRRRRRIKTRRQSLCCTMYYTAQCTTITFEPFCSYIIIFFISLKIVHEQENCLVPTGWSFQSLKIRLDLNLKSCLEGP